MGVVLWIWTWRGGENRRRRDGRGVRKYVVTRRERALQEEAQGIKPAGPEFWPAAWSRARQRMGCWSWGGLQALWVRWEYLTIKTIMASQLQEGYSEGRFVRYSDQMAVELECFLLWVDRESYGWCLGECMVRPRMLWQSWCNPSLFASVEPSSLPNLQGMLPTTPARSDTGLTRAPGSTPGPQMFVQTTPIICWKSHDYLGSSKGMAVINESHVGPVWTRLTLTAWIIFPKSLTEDE